jgi:hypothetical protein
MYKGIYNYLVPGVSEARIKNSGIDASDSVWITFEPVLFYIDKMMERIEIYKILSDHKNFNVIRFVFSPNYSSYLFCYWIMDLLDVLSNELFFVESKIEIYLDQVSYSVYVSEFKDFIRRSIPYLQRHKILPIYAKFILDPDFHIENSVIFGTRFHILFLKENLDHLYIQRLHFNIDL